MNIKTILGMCILACISLYACKDDDGIGEQSTYEVLELSTTYGNIYLHLYDGTPLHRHNFDSLVKEGFYDSTEFHRCVTDFVIQGGSPTSKDDNRNNDATGSPGYRISSEIDSTRFKHKYGAIAAARLGDMTNPQRASSGSQFYIVTNTKGTHFLDGKYTVFGQVLAGMDVAKTIEGLPKNSNGMPNERIKMIIKYVSLTQDQLDEKGIVIP